MTFAEVRLFPGWPRQFGRETGDLPGKQVGWAKFHKISRKSGSAVFFQEFADETKNAARLAGILLLLAFHHLPREAASPGQAPAQPIGKAKGITSPKEHFGFHLGDDYCLANYQQLQSYWSKLAGQSDRLKVVKIGVTEEGRPQLMTVVTAAANHRELARYQDIARRLARAEGVSRRGSRQALGDGQSRGVD